MEAPDKSGKTELGRRIAEALDIPYIKLNNINVETDVEIKDGISISTHSQLETVAQLHEKGVIKDAVLDRFHASENVYSSVFKRSYNISYIKDIEERLSKHNDVILIRPRCSLNTLRNRWREEKLLDIDKLQSISGYYNMFYNNTKLPWFEVDTDQSIDLSLMLALNELNKRGIYSGNPRKRRITHVQAMMNMATIIAKRSPCITRQVGCVLTEDGFLVGAGYNGPPSGLKHDQTDIRKEKGFKSGEGLDFSRDVHAEQNAMQQSGIRSKRGTNLELFTTASPCIHCMRQLIQIGVQKIYYIEKYNHPLAWEMADEAGVEMIQYEE
jgi:dCMP deaminase